ncbi:hypothetical protein ACS0X5_30220 [Burkholderia gladioli]|uniref:hypothetical protein n=1 Tax=Burkholderia gladioli TaxID=28095 RepID=UPI00039E4B14|nr:hypothetical protein [Burkholderia gladioli]MBW5287442.1 hypothetical protein [Burkholderia gladioli]NHH79751.1 hypothetical protein [Burkholderia gladioli]
MNPRLLLALAAGLSLSLAALAQGGAEPSTSSSPSYRYVPPSQTGAMLPAPASATSATGAAAPLGASLPRAYRAPGRAGLTPGNTATHSNRQKLARYRAKPAAAAAASDDAADPYRYDGWSASSVYDNSAPAR